MGVNASILLQISIYPNLYLILDFIIKHMWPSESVSNSIHRVFINDEWL